MLDSKYGTQWCKKMTHSPRETIQLFRIGQDLVSCAVEEGVSGVAESASKKGHAQLQILSQQNFVISQTSQLIDPLMIFPNKFNE